MTTDPTPPAPVVHDFSTDLRDIAEDARRARLRALLSPAPLLPPRGSP